MPPPQLASPAAVDPAPGTRAWWDAHQRRLARRRPRASGLTLERILDASLALVDAEGLDALTVRTLGDRLSTASSSLYRHVASRDELLVLLVDRVLGDVPLPERTDDPRADVVRLAFDLRAVLLAHPRVVPALRAAPLGGPQVRRAAEAGLGLLFAIGHPAEVAVPGFFALLDYVLGSVLFDSVTSATEDVGDPLSSVEDLPGLGPPPGRDEVFAFGLATFLDGLARPSVRAAPASRPSHASDAR